MFLGTPAFAVPSLEVLVRLRDRGAIDLVGVVTQPDRPGHRGRITSPPVKSTALARGVDVIQPEPLPGGGPPWKTSAMWDAVLRLSPDAVVWAAYGGLVPRRVLDAVHGRAVNVHPSLLPRWRGAEPVAHAILAGDRTTGVTLMEGTTELDAGAVIVQMVADVPADATTGELEVDLAEHGARLLERHLPDYLAGKLLTHPQSGTVTWAPKLEPKGGELDFTRPAEEIARVVRAYSPDPGAYTFFRGRRITILRASAVPGADAAAGTLVDGSVVAAGGRVRLDQVIPAGKRPMSGADWVRGLRDLEGARLPS